MTHDAAPFGCVTTELRCTTPLTAADLAKSAISDFNGTRATGGSRKESTLFSRFANTTEFSTLGCANTRSETGGRARADICAALSAGDALENGGFTTARGGEGDMGGGGRMADSCAESVGEGAAE